MLNIQRYYLRPAALILFIPICATLCCETVHARAFQHLNPDTANMNEPFKQYLEVGKMCEESGLISIKLVNRKNRISLVSLTGFRKSISREDLESLQKPISGLGSLDSAHIRCNGPNESFIQIIGSRDIVSGTSKQRVVEFGWTQEGVIGTSLGSKPEIKLKNVN